MINGRGTRFLAQANTFLTLICMYLTDHCTPIGSQNYVGPRSGNYDHYCSKKVYYQEHGHLIE